MPSEKFKEWVLKYNIGPGMNDMYKAEKYKTVEPKNYTGYDGTVGDGWIPILDKLAEDLIAMGWNRDLHQVKEKYGTLRYYIGEGTLEMHERISKAEAESAVTCEKCGAPGKQCQPDGHWVLTLCEECQDYPEGTL